MAAPQPAEVVQSVYAAFGSGDVDRILEACAEPCDWRFVTAAAIPYGGARRSRRDIGEFFAQVAAAEDIAAFEPREVIASGAHVTVLGWERCTPKQGTALRDRVGPRLDGARRQGGALPRLLRFGGRARSAALSADRE
jgi:ketosteroid isomerase-like protein